MVTFGQIDTVFMYCHPFPQRMHVHNSEVDVLEQTTSQPFTDPIVPTNVQF